MKEYKQLRSRQPMQSVHRLIIIIIIIIIMSAPR
jgi:hypothetical protein